MFRAACALVRGYTLPVVTSVRTFSGKCRSGLGTFVVVNDEGWFVTAAHIILQLRDINTLVQQRQANSQPPTTNRQQRRAASKSRGQHADDIENWSVFWGGVGSDIDGEVFIVEAVDLAVGRLKSFDSSKVVNFPEFKDPTKGFDQGASLCRMGFPFYDVGPEFDSSTKSFKLKNVPMPIFPNEGILSRMQEKLVVDAAGNP
jgi:hypothetical protein